MIRPVSHIDIPPIAEIYNHYIRETAVTFEEEEISSDEIRARIQKVGSAGLPGW